MTGITAAEISWTLAAPVDVPAADDLIVDVLLDARAYRELAQQAIHALHGAHHELARRREAHQLTIDEYRAFRQRVLRDAGVTA